MIDAGLVWMMDHGRNMMVAWMIDVPVTDGRIMMLTWMIDDRY